MIFVIPLNKIPFQLSVQWGGSMSDTNKMQTIDRAIQILKSFSSAEKEITLAEFHRKLKIPKSSLQRILNSLASYRIIEKDEKYKTYRLGIELYFLGELVEKNNSLLLASKKYMEDLNKEFDEAVSLNIIDENERKCIGYISSTHELMTIGYVGHTSPLHAGASAKLLLAYLPDEQLLKVLNRVDLTSLTEKTIVNKSKLLEEVSNIRKKGFAISWEERNVGVFSISAPIRNRYNNVIAGISLTIPTVRVEEKMVEKYVKSVQNAADAISKALL